MTLHLESPFLKYLEVTSGTDLYETVVIVSNGMLKGFLSILSGGIAEKIC